METSTQKQEYTPEQYLAMERKAEYKSEFVNNRIFAMAGANRQHNQITFNITVALGIQIKERDCVAYSNDMRVKVSQTGLYTYPDIVATCDKPVFEDSVLDTLLNPSVIIEVLSESTEAYDRGSKFAHYRRLPTLLEYVLISQNNVCVEHYARRNESWVLTEASDLLSIIRLNSIDCVLQLKNIYEKVEFSTN